MIEILAVFLPLIGSALAGLIVFMPQDDKAKQHKMDVLAQWITCTGLILSAICAVILFKDVALDGNARVTELFT